MKKTKRVQFPKAKDFKYLPTNREWITSKCLLPVVLAYNVRKETSEISVRSKSFNVLATAKALFKFKHVRSGQA